VRSLTLNAVALTVVALTGASCGGTNSATAQTPVLETVWTQGRGVIAQNAGGDFDVLPDLEVELRLRVPWPTTLQIDFDGRQLERQERTTPLSDELRANGFYDLIHVEPLGVPSGSDAFWRVFVRVPTGALNPFTSHAISVRDVLIGEAPPDRKISPPLEVRLASFIGTSTSPGWKRQIAAPSQVFFNASAVPDGDFRPAQTRVSEPTPWGRLPVRVTLAGWLWGGDELGAHHTDSMLEDWHYSLWLDDAFVARNYDSYHLQRMVMPGHSYHRSGGATDPMPLAQAGQPPSAIWFKLAGTGEFTVELNAWHPAQHGGSIPPGWITVPTIDPASSWPFDPRAPSDEPSAGEFTPGQYVIISGTLYQDSAHYPLDGDRACWENRFNGYGGWLEIHPVDWIRRLSAEREPQPADARETHHVEGCSESGEQTKEAIVSPLRPAPRSDDVLHALQILDPRFTVGSVTPSLCRPDDKTVRVTVKFEKAFNSIVVLWWASASRQPEAIPPACP
jgi:hypothetical protein